MECAIETLAIETAGSPPADYVTCAVVVERTARDAATR